MCNSHNNNRYCGYISKMKTYAQRAKYITCDHSPDGTLWPMGIAKTLEKAEEVAKLHRQVLCELIELKDYSKPDYYYGSYILGVDPEATCWHCGKTFLCDCCDATCRLCHAPFDKKRCKEFNFIPNDGPGT